MIFTMDKHMLILSWCIANSNILIIQLDWQRSVVVVSHCIRSKDWSDGLYQTKKNTLIGDSGMDEFPKFSYTFQVCEIYPHYMCMCLISFIYWPNKQTPEKVSSQTSTCHRECICACVWRDSLSKNGFRNSVFDQFKLHCTLAVSSMHWSAKLRRFCVCVCVKCSLYFLVFISDLWISPSSYSPSCSQMRAIECPAKRAVESALLFSDSDLTRM